MQPSFSTARRNKHSKARHQRRVINKLTKQQDSPGIVERNLRTKLTLGSPVECRLRGVRPSFLTARLNKHSKARHQRRVINKLTKQQDSPGIVERNLRTKLSVICADRICIQSDRSTARVSELSKPVLFNLAPLSRHGTLLTWLRSSAADCFVWQTAIFFECVGCVGVKTAACNRMVIGAPAIIRCNRPGKKRSTETWTRSTENSPPTSDELFS